MAKSEPKVLADLEPGDFALVEVWVRVGQMTKEPKFIPARIAELMPDGEWRIDESQNGFRMLRPDERIRAYTRLPPKSKSGGDVVLPEGAI